MIEKPFKTPYRLDPAEYVMVFLSWLIYLIGLFFFSESGNSWIFIAFGALPVMVTAIVIAVIFMMLFSGVITRFIDRRPTIKILALSFLLLIGVALIGEGLDMHIPKGYIYFAMAFSVFVETLNLRVRGSQAPVQLRHRYLEK